MSKYFVFGKSMWEEQPRLRHQLVELLLQFGNVVTFFQTPSYLWSGDISNNRVASSNLTLKRSRQLIHPQLRIAAPLRILNALIETRSIRAIIGSQVTYMDVVINFNYDYYFLRKIFPKNTIVTIINDDFVAQAKLRRGDHVRDVMKLTCAASDVVFGVSYPLLDQLSQWCTPKLFLPWADSFYCKHAKGIQDSVLLWGHIDRRIDFDLLAAAANELPSVHFYIVGPLSNSIKSQADSLRRFANVVMMPATRLQDLPLERFFAAIIPYKNYVNDIIAVTLSNKALQLMSRGLPLVTHGMPNFMDNESILRCASVSDFLDAIKYAQKNYEGLQRGIGKFVNRNQARDRYEYLLLAMQEQKEGASV
jgi:hypothetical protein